MNFGFPGQLFFAFSTILALSTGKLFALEGEAQVPADIQKLLRETNLKRQQAVREHFLPIVLDLQQRAAADPQRLYLDAVSQVFFSKDSNPQKAYIDWKIQNRSLIADPRLPAATALASLYLQGQLQLLIGNQKDGVACLDSMISGIRNESPNLTQFHLLQETIENGLLTRFYEISGDYFKGNGYYGPPMEVERIFVQVILPWVEKNDPKAISAEWDNAIAAIGRMASASEKSADRFELTEEPRLLVLKADSLLSAGQQKDAVDTLKSVLQRFPEYPQYTEVTTKLLQIVSTPKEAAP